MFTVVSFSVGESLWPWMVAALLALVPVLAAVLLRGVREAPRWLAVVAPAAVVGFIGAYQWVSYAFVAPRLLFLLPFYLLLLVRGARAWTGLGTTACTGVALLSLCGLAAYFEQTGFLNKAYVSPTGPSRTRSAPARTTDQSPSFSITAAATSPPWRPACRARRAPCTSQIQ